MSEKTALYRYFDADDRLLYVGISVIPPMRQLQHAKGSAWYELVDRQRIEWFETRAEAMEAERSAIRSEGPTWNRAHNPEWVARRREAAEQDRRDRKARKLWAARKSRRSVAASAAVLTEPQVYPVASGPTVRWGDPGASVVRLHDLTAEQRRLVLALVEAAKNAEADRPRIARMSDLSADEREVVTGLIEAKQIAAREAHASQAGR